MEAITTIGENTMSNRENIDRDAEREGLALKKQGRDKQSRWHYIREQTSDHNTEKMRKLFGG